MKVHTNKVKKKNRGSFSICSGAGMFLFHFFLGEYSNKR